MSSSLRGGYVTVHNHNIQNPDPLAKEKGALTVRLILAVELAVVQGELGPIPWWSSAMSTTLRASVSCAMRVRTSGASAAAEVFVAESISTFWGCA